jgi:hypothetical protein
MQTQHLPNDINMLMSTTNPLTIARPVTATSSGTSSLLPPGTSQHPSILPSPTNGGISNQNNPTRLGPFHGAYLISPLPVQSTSHKSSVPRIPDDTNPAPTPDVVWAGTGLSSPSTGDVSYTSELDCSSDTDTITAGSAYPDREPDENRDLGDERTSSLRETRTSNPFSFNYPPSIGGMESEWVVLICQSRIATPLMRVMVFCYQL